MMKKSEVALMIPSRLHEAFGMLSDEEFDIFVSLLEGITPEGATLTPILVARAWSRTQDFGLTSSTIAIGDTRETVGISGTNQGQLLTREDFGLVDEGHKNYNLPLFSNAFGEW